jgi:hypothetical protein
LSTENNDQPEAPKIPLDDIEDGGADDMDATAFPKHGGLRPDTGVDQSTIASINDATTALGGIAISGGKLAGNKDDFEGDLVYRERKTPGANPDNGVTPAHDMDSGDTRTKL